MNKRKVIFRILLPVLVACGVLAVCLLTDPADDRNLALQGSNCSDLDPQAIVARICKAEGLDGTVYTNANNFGLELDGDFNWSEVQTIRYFFYRDHKTRSGQLCLLPDKQSALVMESCEWPEQDSIYLLYAYLQAIKYLPQDTIRQLAPADGYRIVQIEEGTPADYDRVITYCPDGAEEIDGWEIHLRLEPLHRQGNACVGSEEETVELFYSSRTLSTGELLDAGVRMLTIAGGGTGSRLEIGESLHEMGGKMT